MFSHFRSGWQESSTTEKYWQVNYSWAASPSPRLHPKWHVSPWKSVLIPQHDWPHWPPESQKTLAWWKMNGSNDEPNTSARLETIYQRSIWSTIMLRAPHHWITFRWQSASLVHSSHQRQCHSKLMQWMIQRFIIMHICNKQFTFFIRGLRRLC